MADSHEQVFPTTILSILKILCDTHRLGKEIVSKMFAT